MIADYRSHLENEDHSDLTIKVYLSDVEAFAAWFGKTNREALEPARVTPSDLRSYRQHLQEELRQKASTVNRKLASLSSWLRWAVDSGQIAANPLDKVKYVNRVIASPKWLDKHEQYALQRAVEKDLQIAQLRYPKRWRTRRRDASLVVFMLNTGLRLSETTSVRLGDIEFTERKGQVLVRQGKGNKERAVPLNVEARAALREWLSVRPQGADDCLWIATEEDAAGGLTPRAVQRVLKRYGQEAGIPNLTPHVLRHTFAKNLADRHIGVEVIAQLLGHENLNTTQVYIKPNYMDLENALEE
jgi:site-specific recombinase XerD